MKEKEFQVSSEIYDSTKMQEAIFNFSEISEIILKNEVLVITGETEEEIQEVFHEFMNYVLSL